MKHRTGRTLHTPREEYTVYHTPDPRQDVYFHGHEVTLSLADLGQERPDSVKMTIDEARLLGLALIRNADQAEEEMHS